MHFDTATTIAFVLGWVIPHASSLLSNTKAVPAWAGGYVTLLLSCLTGFLSEWAHALAGNQPYSWAHGALSALGAFLIAAMTRTVVSKNTPADNKLLDLGASRANRRGGKPAPAPGPYEAEHEAA